jgi:hypothetical protein
MVDQPVSLIELPVTPSGDFCTPGKVPTMGERRLVRLLPTPFGSRPAIWISPYTVDVEINGTTEKCKVAVVLLDKGPPAPSVVTLTLPAGAVEKFPLIPVEW